MSTFENEVAAGKRFPFGRNWSHFLRHLNVQRVQQAEENLVQFLGLKNIENRSIVDVGCGSGLSSLAMRRLGAIVHSFDFDPNSVSCTAELKHQFFPYDEQWKVERGSILDTEYLRSLGKFDVAYSWGVLHHTGAMWEAMQNLSTLVKPGGLMFIAIYADCGELSKHWHNKKRRYNALPRFFRPLYAAYAWVPTELRMMGGSLRDGKLGEYFRTLRTAEGGRGMSRYFDIIDWVGGYPYEYATVEAIIKFCAPLNFEPIKIYQNRSFGCHQLVLKHLAGC